MKVAALLVLVGLACPACADRKSAAPSAASAAPVASETPHEAIDRLNAEAAADAERERLERDGPPPPAAPPPPPTIVTADVFGQEVEDNGIAASETYAGRFLLTGKAKSVEVDILDRPLVKLHTKNSFKHVQAMLEDGNEDAAKSIKAGQDVWLSCAGAKKVVYAQALACTVVKKPEPPKPAPVARPSGTGTIIDVNAL